MPPRSRPTLLLARRSHPTLQEVCGILARGLIRLRAGPGKSSEVSRDHGESRLDFIPNQSGHANPSRQRNA